MNAWARVRTPTGIVAVACAWVVLLRLPFVSLLPYVDEGGLLVVARHWHTGGPRLYGWLFVDRPPILLLYYRLGAALGGITAIRVLALALVAGAVVSAGWAGLMAGGRKGAAVAAVVAAALLADPALGTLEVNAETVGVPLTLLASALVIRAFTGTPPRPAARAALIASAGALGVCALLAKQNLVDALVLGVVLAVVSGTRATWRRTSYDVGWLVLGALVPTLVAVVWAAVAAGGVGTLWFTLFQFRLDALQVIVAHPAGAAVGRLLSLAHDSLLSGMLVVVLVSAWLLRRRALARDPLTLAIGAMLVAEAAGALAGGSYWSHYLVALVPGASLLAARAAGSVTRTRLLVAAVVLAVASGAVHTAARLPQATAATSGTALGRISTWLDRASRPGDTGVVVYGYANLFETSRLRPAYPYLWTLPMRTLDPHLDRLVGLLDQRHGPTFVLEPRLPNAWGIDPHGRVTRALAAHYRFVGHACGIPVYLHDGVRRPAPPPPKGCAP